MQEILNFTGQLSPEVWAYLFGALGLSALLQKFKHKLELENPKVILFISSVLSLAAVAIPAILTAGVSDPLILGQHTAAFLGLMELIYRFIVKPSSNFLGDVRVVRELAATTKPDVPKTVALPPTTGFPVITPPAEEAGVPKEFQG